jgi:hypothetical protein
MTRIWTDGFELGDFAGYTLVEFNTSGYVTNSDLNPNGGGRSIRFNTPGFQQRWGFVRSLDDDLDELFVRAWVYFSDPINPTGADQETFMTLLALTGSSHLTFDRNKTTGNIVVRRGDYYSGQILASGSQNMARDRWYCIEVHAIIDDTNGVCQVRIDGGPSLDIDYEGDTRNSAGYLVHSVAFGSIIPTINGLEALRGYIDDVAINDANGSSDNGWCGQGKVLYLPVEADYGPNEWTPSDDESGVDHASYLSDVPHDADTTYLSTLAADNVETFETGTTGLDGPLVRRAWAEGRIRRVDASSTVLVSLGVTSGVSTDYSPDREPLTTYEARILGSDLRLNPDTGNAWGIDEVDAALVSMKSTEPE